MRHAARPVGRHALAVGLVAASTLVIGIGVGPGSALDRMPGPWHRDHGSDDVATATRETGRDVTSCADRSDRVTTTTSTAPATGMAASQTVTVVVPPMVRVESDADGVLGVITNSARPPAPGDQVYRLQANGDYAPADEALVARVMSARWADGSWCSTTAVHRSVDSDDNHDDRDDRDDRHDR